ncbi:acyltransferase family protein [Chitinophaga sancti]|uniref:Acyltransferase n=1 Tax=Chitinophaga sancti TaxID=1004 RepID=A0A1K1N762_9BACT|nr:acyltransferase [Chitinophaga sancti]WQD63490.1 acyltransferase [Chitinophaga sancti]WQG90884.1 acyltransferase [Chitinophaga sancti]SFW31180.1 Fucose 4-O-acetylase [Chitinophaga sancti]
MSTAKPGNRLAWIDYARGIAIILVLYRHIFEGISRSGVEAAKFSWLENANIIFYSFRMPLFFILSGVFIGKSLAKRGMKSLIVNKFNILLYPYLLWSALQITIQICLSGLVNANRGIADYGYIFLFPRRIDQFWYLYALFNVTVLYILTREKLRLKIWHQLLIGFAAYMYSSYLSVHHIDLGFIYDICHFYVFFAIGELIADHILDSSRYALYSSWKLFWILLPFFAVGQYYFLVANLNNQYNLFVEEHQPLLFALIALVGCAFMINISFLLQRYGSVKLLRVAGFHSLYIYVSHVLVASAVRMCLVKVFHITYLPVLLVICLCFAVVIPILLYKAAMRAGAWWLYSLEKPMELKLS